MPVVNLEDETVGLWNMAEVLNRELKLEGEHAIAQRSPYAWWRRHKAGELPLGMPKPGTMLGERSPLWRTGAIVRWYKAWKEL